LAAFRFVHIDRTLLGAVGHSWFHSLLVVQRSALLPSAASHRLLLLQVRRWDSETGKLLSEAQVHEADIQDMQLSPDGSYVITASLDKTAKLVDIQGLDVLKTYKTGRFVQSAAISPLYDHVLLGGGQDASQVSRRLAAEGADVGHGQAWHKWWSRVLNHAPTVAVCGIVRAVCPRQLVSCAARCLLP